MASLLFPDLGNIVLTSPPPTAHQVLFKFSVQIPFLNCLSCNFASTSSGKRKTPVSPETSVCLALELSVYFCLFVLCLGCLGSGDLGKTFGNMPGGDLNRAKGQLTK